MRSSLAISNRSPTGRRRRSRHEDPPPIPAVGSGRGKLISTFYDELPRIPVMPRLPGKTRAGALVHTPASTCDISPTILHLLGLPVPEALHGRILRAFIEGKSDSGRQVFCERTASLAKPGTHFHHALSTAEWKYDYQLPGASQLFHLSKDPGETWNWIDDRSARLALKTR